MPDISITCQHKLSHQEAKAAVQQLADKLAERYDVSSAWSGDVLSFTRSGVSGTLEVSATQARLDIELGLGLKFFASAIEEQADKSLKKVFGT